MLDPETRASDDPASLQGEQSSSTPQFWKTWAFPAVVVLIVLGVLAALIIPAALAAHRSSRRTDDKNRLKQLGIYYAMYESRFKAYPSEMKAFEAWLQKEGADSKSLLMCSRCGKRLTLLLEQAPAGSFRPESGSTYSWTTKGITDGAPPDLPIAWHRCPLARSGDDMNVLFFQGRVDVIAIGSPSERALQELENPPPKPK